MTPKKRLLDFIILRLVFDICQLEASGGFGLFIGLLSLKVRYLASFSLRFFATELVFSVEIVFFAPFMLARPFPEA